MPLFFFFFFNDTATTEIYTLSLHDALPICRVVAVDRDHGARKMRTLAATYRSEVETLAAEYGRSEEHTSELQSRLHLVCRLLLEKKKKKMKEITHERSKRARLYLMQSRI